MRYAKIWRGIYTIATRAYDGHQTEYNPTPIKYDVMFFRVWLINVVILVATG